MADQIQADDLNLTERLEIQKELLKLQLQSAFEKRKKLSISDVNAGNLPEISPENSVFVKGQNSHLYPWLLGESVKIIGYNDEQAQEFTEREANHEYEHYNGMPNDREHFFGLRFFEIVDEKGNYYSDGVCPAFHYIGEVSPEEQKIILGSPSDLSPSDQRNIKDIDAK